MKEMIESFFKWFVNLFEPLFDLIDDNHDNPILWISLLVIGLVLGKITYNILNKKG